MAARSGKISRWLVAWALGIAGASAADAPFFSLDLAGVKNLPPGMEWVAEGPRGGPCLKVSAAPGGEGESRLVNLPIDIEALRDHEILLTYDVRAEHVSEPEKEYNGIKCQLHWKSEAEGPRWVNEGRLSGNFDWRRSALLIRVDSDARDGVLQVGLQECSGTAWIANVELAIVRKKPDPVAVPFRGHGVSRLRGMVGAGWYSESDFADMAAWGVNVVRWRLLNTKWARTAIPSQRAVYEPWLNAKLDELEKLLNHAQREGILVVVDLHSPPGGRLEDGTLRMLLDPELGSYFVEIWTRIARRFRGHPALWAYDLMNEPVQKRPSPPGALDWWQLQDAAARAVRKIDHDTVILIEADDWSSPEAFAWMRPVDVPRVVYSVHMYWPYEFTHQGIAAEWSPEGAFKYPGRFNGKSFDPGALERRLAPVVAFQRLWNVHIYVGEFSVVRWAPGGAKYLADCIRLFEKYGWDWTYHAFRESGEWSLEHSDLPHGEPAAVALEPTGRMDAVTSWFRQNEKPDIKKH